MAAHDHDPPIGAVRSFPLYDGGVPCVRTGHGGFVFSCCGSSGHMSLHDTSSGEPIISLHAAAEHPTTLSVSSDAEKAAFGTASGALYVWDVQYPTSMESFRPEEDAHFEITSLAWHPRGHVLAAAAATGTLYLWDMVVGALLYPVPAHASRIAAVKWTANGRLLVSAGHDGALRVWNPRNVEQVGEISSDSQQDEEASVATNATDAAKKAGAVQGSTVKWHSAPLTALDTLHDLSRVALTGAADGSVLLSVLKPESACGVFCEMPVHKDRSAVTAVRFAPLDSPKPLRAASAAADGSVHLFDMDRRLPMGSFNHPADMPVKQLEFSAHADVLFSAAGPTVVAWDARVAPEEERPVTFAQTSDNDSNGSAANVDAFTLINNGTGIVTACADGQLRVYDVRYPSGEVPSTEQVVAKQLPKPSA